MKLGLFTACLPRLSLDDIAAWASRPASRRWRRQPGHPAASTPTRRATSTPPASLRNAPTTSGTYSDGMT